ncbi:hypothetical protein C9446_08875 [Providencia heimbachae]|nr:hypothetical protein C9446_08875 [Providencia heimbachae]
MQWQKSADAVVVLSKPIARRAEPITSGKSHVLSERVAGTSYVNNIGLNNKPERPEVRKAY